MSNKAAHRTERGGAAGLGRSVGRGAKQRTGAMFEISRETELSLLTDEELAGGVYRNDTYCMNLRRSSRCNDAYPHLWHETPAPDWSADNFVSFDNYAAGQLSVLSA